MDSLEYKAGEKIIILCLDAFPRTDTNQKGWGGAMKSNSSQQPVDQPKMI